MLCSGKKGCNEGESENESGLKSFRVGGEKEEFVEKREDERLGRRKRRTGDKMILQGVELVHLGIIRAPPLNLP